MGAGAVRPGGTGAASSRTRGGSRFANCVGCLWSVAGSFSAGSADQARESARGDRWHALRVGDGAVFVEVVAGSFHLVGRDRDLRNGCGGIRCKRFMESFIEGLNRGDRGDRREKMDKRAKENHSRPELARDLGLSHAGAIVVGTIIGSGIFLVPSEMMQAGGTARLVYHSRPELARDLGLSHAGAIVVGTIIGSGIFLVPSEMMQAVGTARLVYLAWMAGGLLSFFGALTYAELGAMKPQAGGEYVYVRDAYGPLAGFLYSWTWFLIAKPASIATVTTGL